MVLLRNVFENYSLVLLINMLINRSDALNDTVFATLEVMTFGSGC